MKNVMAFVKEHGPELLTGAGIAGMTTSAVMACAATRKIDPVLESHKQRAEEARKKMNKREMMAVYAKTAADFARLYGIPVCLATLSAVGIISSNDILRKRVKTLRKRNAALAAAYATLDTSFRTYRERVKDLFGVQADEELRCGAHTEKIETVETDDKGKEKKVKKEVLVAGNGAPSDYARYFAYGDAKAAEPNDEYNRFFLKGQQELANAMLRANGFLFLNEVYDMLGIDKSVAGQVVGWVYDKNRDDHGDNYVDFGIRDIYRKREDGTCEKVILLDFNVDGEIVSHAVGNGLLSD